MATCKKDEVVYARSGLLNLSVAFEEENAGGVALFGLCVSLILICIWKRTMGK
jgi:hypothetical protein